MVHRFDSGVCVRCGMSEGEASDGYTCLPRWAVRLAIALVTLSLVLFAIGVMGLCKAAWGDTLPGCCTTSSGSHYSPDTLFGSVNHGCATGDIWTATPCSTVQPTPTPTPIPGPCTIRPHFKPFVWHYLDTAIPTTVFYVCRASLDGCWIDIVLLEPPVGWLLGPHLRYGGCCGVASGSVPVYNLGHVLIRPDGDAVESIVVVQNGRAIPPDGF